MTVPLLALNLEVLEELQVPKKDREELQKSLVRTATKHAGNNYYCQTEEVAHDSQTSSYEGAPKGGEG